MRKSLYQNVLYENYEEITDYEFHYCQSSKTYHTNGHCLQQSLLLFQLHQWQTVCHILQLTHTKHLKIHFFKYTPITTKTAATLATIKITVYTANITTFVDVIIILYSYLEGNKSGLNFYSLNFHSCRHIGHKCWTCWEFSHFIIQWMWKQWEHWPHTVNRDTGRYSIIITLKCTKPTNCLFYGFFDTFLLHSSVPNDSIKCAW